MMHLKDSPDCHNQNVELDGERVEPDRNCKDWINLLLVVAPFAGLDLERFLQCFIGQPVSQGMPVCNKHCQTGIVSEISIGKQNIVLHF